MLIKYIAYIPSIIGVMLVFAFIGLSNYKNKLNQLFMLLTCVACFWIISLFIADTTTNLNIALWSVRTGVAISTFLGPIFLLFSSNFPKEKKTRRFYLLCIFVPAFILGILSVSPYMIQSVSIMSEGATLNKVSLLYTIDTLALVVYFASGAYALLKKRVHVSYAQKRQINFVLLGILIVFFTNFIVGYLLPSIGIRTDINLIGAFSIFIFSVILAYAMFKHSLFDVRLLAARSLAYLLSLVTTAGVFVFVAYTLSTLFFKNSSVNYSYLRLLYSFLAIILAIIFQPLKHFFDKITNRVFFRDSYDVQVFLDRFNKILVSTFELNLMLTKIADLIELNIKPVYCLFVIKENDNYPRRLIGTKHYLNFHKEGINIINSATKRLHSKIIATDLLEDKYSDDRRLLQQHNVSIITKLLSSNSGEGVGYLVLGSKKSGNMYSSQDIKILEIIANELVIAVQNALHTEDIENFNLTLQEKIKEATHRLRTTNEKLRALDEAKDDFVSMASHQLRTPLTSVKGNISLVLDGDAGKISSLQKQLLEQAFASSQRMVYLIADLLNVSRLKTGKFIIEQSAVDLASVIEEEVKQLVETAKSRNLELNYQKPEKITHLMLDETKTRQVIMNFVDNAIYYTPSGGRIDVILSENNNDVECRVVDNGIGVPKSEQPHLFTKFYRAANARKARPDGTGLGLFMAKKVIIAEGGAIIFDTQEGKGSTFGFSFPKAALAVKTSSVQNQPQEQAAVAI